MTKTIEKIIKNGVEYEIGGGKDYGEGSDIFIEGGKLPTGYTQIEYAQSDATFGINTGRLYDGTSDLKIEARFMGTAYNGGGAAPFGLQNVGYTNWIYPFYGEGSTVFTYWGNLVRRQEGYYHLNKMYTVRFVTEGSTFYREVNSVDDVVGTYDKTAVSTTSPLFIFSGGVGTTATNAFAGRIYSLRIWKGGVLDMNLIPAKRNSDNAIGMYDVVGNNFFTHSSLVAGPTVTNAYSINAMGVIVDDGASTVSRNPAMNCVMTNYVNNNTLLKTNTTAYTPTADYHPATKKYVDDNSGGGSALAKFLLVGGGGAGGNGQKRYQYSGGGGGGSSVVEGCIFITKGQEYNIVVGTNGVKSTAERGTGGSGGNSKFQGYVALGGGGGGGNQCGGCCGGNGGGNGGCGCSSILIDWLHGGNQGGPDSNGVGGGGGGATASGSGQNGGQGYSSDISGTTIVYGSGGGGGGASGGGGSGGTGAGAGGYAQQDGNNATTYGSGGGGGGSSGGNYYRCGGNGCQGALIISYPASSGLTLSGSQCCYTCNGSCIHIVTQSGTICIN